MSARLPPGRPANHVVVFVRAPRVGAVKRRLAAGCGAVAAWQFYRRCTARALAALASEPRWRCWLAVAPDCFVDQGRFWPAGIQRLPQGSGDLGQCMARVFANLPPGPAVIVGSDIPDLTRRHVAAAFAALSRHQAVFGPAADGGYWLIGLKRRPAPPLSSVAALFRGVRWSSPHALADTRANLPPGWSVAWLDTLADVDWAADLVHWQRRARRNGDTADLVSAPRATAPGQAGFGSSPSVRRGRSSTKLQGRNR